MYLDRFSVKEFVGRTIKQVSWFTKFGISLLPQIVCVY